MLLTESGERSLSLFYRLLQLRTLYMILDRFFPKGTHSFLKGIAHYQNYRVASLNLFGSVDFNCWTWKFIENQENKEELLTRQPRGSIISVDFATAFRMSYCNEYSTNKLKNKGGLRPPFCYIMNWLLEIITHKQVYLKVRFLWLHVSSSSGTYQKHAYKYIYNKKIQL